MVMATFMSNTAIANLLLPTAVASVLSKGDMASYGGTRLMVMCVALSVSLGMSLPTSKSPNALAHTIGLLVSKDFIRTVKFISTMGVMLIFLTITLLGMVG